MAQEDLYGEVDNGVDYIETSPRNNYGDINTQMNKKMTEKKHCSFPEIGQYRNVVKTIQERTRYAGKDDDGNIIYDNMRKMPVIDFTGTVKLHGTNSGVTFSAHDLTDSWAQSRENVLTISDDNAGFATFVKSHLIELTSLATACLIDSAKYSTDFDYITIFGEWCGQGIQKGVAITQLPKMFVIFDVKYSFEDISKGINIYADEDFIKTLRYESSQIYNIYDYKTYRMTIDFDQPALAQNKMIELVSEVEEECPVGKAFGVSGVGEGIVWRYKDSENTTYRFKTKGEKHSSSKVKTLVPVDVEKINSINEFVEYAVTESRLEQAVEKTFGIGKEPEVEKMGDFIRWVVNDVQKEEFDTMVENGLIPKDINSSISKKCRNWLLNKINTF